MSEGPPFVDGSRPVPRGARLGTLAGRALAVAGLETPLGQALDAALGELCPAHGPLLDVHRRGLDGLLTAVEEKPRAILWLPDLASDAVGLPLDDALERGPDTAERLARFAARTGIPVVMASSLDVIGRREGLIAERTPLDPPFPDAQGPRDPRWSVEGERAAALAVVERVRARAEHADVRSSLDEAARRDLAATHQPSSGTALAEEVTKRRAAYLRSALEEAGQARARGWGFLSARGYALALAEQVLVSTAQSAPVVVVRLPALGPPATGHLDDRLALEELPLRALLRHIARGDAGRMPAGVLDVLPLDLAARALLVAAAKAPSTTAAQLCHASLGGAVIPLDRVAELADLHLRQQRRSALSSSSSSASSLKDPATRLIRWRGLAERAVPLLRDAALAARDAVMGELGPADAGPGVEAHSPLSDVPLRSSSTRLHARTLRLWARELAGPADDLYRPDLVDGRRYLLDRLFPAIDALERGGQRRAAAGGSRELTRRAHDSIVHLLEEAAARHGRRPALSMFVGDDRTDVSYGELLTRARAVATRLVDHGVRPGDRVALAGKNHPAWPIAAFGVLGAGAHLVPLDPALTSAQVKNVLAKAAPAAVIVDRGARSSFDDALTSPPLDLHLTATPGPARHDAWRTPAPDDVASILFTSGTTGDPKGVMLSHRNFMALIASLGEVFTPTGDDRALSVLPLHHTLEFSCGLLLPLAAGAQIFYVDELSGERLLFTLKRGRITGMVGVPAVWQLLDRRIRSQVKERGETAETLFDLATRLNQKLGEATGLDLGRVLFRSIHDELGGHLRLLISGGAALPKDVHGLFQGLGLHLAEGYGLTETAPVLTVAEGAPGAPSGTVGRPIPGVELRLGNTDETGVGEVLARGPNIMLGYFDNAAATAAVVDNDGWLRTGDLGRFDASGRLVIVGRAKEVVVTSAGENVYLDDVEEQIGTVPGVAELSLLGIEDGRGGERLACAYVLDAAGARAPPDGGSTSGVDGVSRLKAVIARLPATFRPSVVVEVEGPLPRTATLKVKRKDVRPLLETALARAPAGGATAPSRDDVPASAPVRAAVALVAGVDVATLTARTGLAADLGFDSLMWVELAGALEPLVGRLDAETLYACETLGALEALVQRPGSMAAARPDASPSPTTDRIVVPDVVKGPARSVLARAQHDLYRTLFTTEVEGRAHIPQNRVAIVVANHSSHLDTGLVKFALGRYGKRLRPLAAKDYFFEGNPFKVAFFEHLTHLVPLDRTSGSGAAFDQARDLVEAGEILLIYPEGTRGGTGVLQPFKPLVGRLSLLTGAPVLPLWLDGAFDALPKGAAVPRQRRLNARIGPPLEAHDLLRLTEGRSPVEAAREATAIIQAAVAALGERRPFDAGRLGAGDVGELTARAQAARGSP